MTGITNAPGGKDRYRVKVFGGTSAPANPKESYIWIRTSVPVSGYEINCWTSSLPSWQIGNGFVYIYGEPAYDENKVINLIEDNGNVLYFNFKMCMQQQGTNWYKMDAFVYRRGSWMQFASSWDGTLFYNGNQYADVTGGWVGADSYSPNLTATLMSGTITISTANAVDLSRFSTLKFTGSGNGTLSGEFYPAKCKIFNESGAEVASLDFQNNNTYAVSVAALSGKHYVRFVATGSRGNNLNISKVWLE